MLLRWYGLALGYYLSKGLAAFAARLFHLSQSERTCFDTWIISDLDPQPDKSSRILEHGELGCLGLSEWAISFSEPDERYYRLWRNWNLYADSIDRNYNADRVLHHHHLWYKWRSEPFSYSYSFRLIL